MVYDTIAVHAAKLQFSDNIFRSLNARKPRCVVDYSSAPRSRHVRKSRGGRLEDLYSGYVLCYEEQTLACLYPWESLDTVPGSA